MDFIPKYIEEYAQLHTESESDLLKHIDRETHLKEIMPRMLSGHIQGKMLGILAAMQAPKNIVEIGSYTGYSALAMAETTSSDCIIHCMEKDEELGLTLQKNIQQSAYANRIHLHLGDALDLLPTIEFKADFIFLDADKANYPKYYPLLKNILSKDGSLLVDNVLWSGKVTEKAKENDKETLGIQIFNQMVQQDPEVSNVLLPIRDGIMLIRKKQ
jgi:caffeoyl-CoA O-methyltransferase